MSYQRDLMRRDVALAQTINEKIGTRGAEFDTAIETIAPGVKGTVQARRAGDGAADHGARLRPHPHPPRCRRGGDRQDRPQPGGHRLAGRGQFRPRRNLVGRRRLCASDGGGRARSRQPRGERRRPGPGWRVPPARGLEHRAPRQLLRERRRTPTGLPRARASSWPAADAMDPASPAWLTAACSPRGDALPCSAHRLSAQRRPRRRAAAAALPAHRGRRPYRPGRPPCHRCGGRPARHRLRRQDAAALEPARGHAAQRAPPAHRARGGGRALRRRADPRRQPRLPPPATPARSWDGAFALYVFDTATGRLLARLPGLPAPVQHLAVLARRHAARRRARRARPASRSGMPATAACTWRTPAIAGPARDGRLRGAPGRLAVAAADGRSGSTRRMAGRNWRSARRYRARSPTASPSRPKARCWCWASRTGCGSKCSPTADLRTVFAPDVSGLAGEGLPAVAWAHDEQRRGAALCRRAMPGKPRAEAAGRRADPRGAGRRGPPRRPAGAPDDIAIRRTSRGGRGLVVRQQQPAPSRAARPRAGLPAGHAARIHDPPLGRFRPRRRHRHRRRARRHRPGGAAAAGRAGLCRGRSRLGPHRAGWHAWRAPRPPGGDFRNYRRAPSRSRADGTQAAVLAARRRHAAGLRRRDRQPHRLGRARRRASRPRGPTRRGIAVQDWRNSNRPAAEQTAAAARAGRIRPLPGDPASRDDGFLLGTDTHLRLFDAPAG